MIDSERRKPPERCSAKQSGSMKLMLKHISTLAFFWRMTARMRRQRAFSEQQRSLTQILTKRAVGSEFCCKHSEDTLRLRTSSSALSQLILRTQSPISISTAWQMGQAQVNRESLRR